MINFKKLYGDYLTVKNYLDVEKRILGISKRVILDESKMLDIDIYGDLKTAKKIAILSHTFAGNSDHFYNVYLAERFYLHGYVVVAINMPGFRNIITTEPFTGEKKSMLRLGLALDNVLEYIRKENHDAPIVVSAFSAGGTGLINHFCSNERYIAGAVVVAATYYVPNSANINYLCIPAIISLSYIYTRNFLKTQNYKKIIKLFDIGLDLRRLIRINNDEKLYLQRNNLTNMPVVALHCTDDTVIDIALARMYFKRMNSPVSKLIEFSDQGHSLTYTVVGVCIEQSDIMCDNWLKVE